MSFERADFEQLLKRELAESGKRLRPQLERTVQAAVAVEHLTGSAEWDYFLSRVEVRRKEIEAARDRAKEILLGPEANAERYLEARLRFHAMQEALVHLEWVLSVPAEVASEGERARKMLHAAES